MPCDITKTSSEIENVDWSTGTGSGQHYTNVRFGSGSSQASQSSGDICRICHCESDPQNPLLTPCYCAGSLKYVHQACLQQWLTASETNSCELCKFPFIMHTKIKPFNEWRSLDISGVERRRLCCSVLFHCAAALCVIWSLCVLIERAADDVARGLIDWPFWTKLAVVTVGLTGGVVFMYIQCKAYLHLCHRWKARNRILLIQNAPEKVHPLSPPSPIAQHHHSRYSSSQEPRNLSIQNPNSAQVGTAGANAVIQNVFNYSNAAGACAGNSEIDGAAALHNNALNSPHHILQRVDMDIDATPRISSATGNITSQPGQIVANIECSQSQHNYERDWALDDVVSQISSFRPCPQGSGSMTPFHDSIHNALEHSQSSSRGSVNDVCGSSRQDLSTGGISSDTGREHVMQLSSFSGSGIHKEPSISSGVSAAVANGIGGFVYKPQSKRYSNSSIFLENRDILNDSVMLNMDTNDGYPKINYRHSSVLTSPDISDNLDKYLGKDLRRYSDTKLLASDSDLLDPMLFKTAGGIETVGNKASSLPPPPECATTKNASILAQQRRAGSTAKQLMQREQFTSGAKTILDMELPTSPLFPTQAAFCSSSNNNSCSSSSSHKQGALSLCRSMHTVDIVDDLATKEYNVTVPSKTAEQQQIDKDRLFFKSLPNLSSSCESLIKK